MADEPIPYPAHRYHKETGDVHIVNSQAEADALGSDWTDTPPLAAHGTSASAPQQEREMDWEFTKAEKNEEGP